jgi:hypothetical protein
MHSGRFEPLPISRSASAAGLDDRRVDRRTFVRALAAFGVGGLGLGAVAGRALPGSAAAGRGRVAGEPEVAPDLAWALSMVERSDLDLVEAAGDLEMVCARHRGDRRLVAVFDRMLEAALWSTAAQAPVLDVAGACAIRCLGRLGVGQLALERSDAIAAGGERPLTAAALDVARRRAAGRPPEGR